MLQVSHVANYVLSRMFHILGFGVAGVATHFRVFVANRLGFVAYIEVL
jgi:hypothetical protein